MNNNKAVIFDMDGVLIDSEPIYMHIFNEFLSAHGNEVDMQKVYKVIGTANPKTFEIIGKLFNDPINSEQAMELFEKFTPEIGFNYQDLLNPHVNFILNKLQANNIQIGLASASSRESIDKMKKENNIEQFFGYTVSGQEVKHSKPAPDVYLKTMEKLNVEPANTIVLEDSPSGIQAGKASGATVIAIKDTRYNLDQSKADYIASDFIESFYIIQKLWNIK